VQSDDDVDNAEQHQEPSNVQPQPGTLTLATFLLPLSHSAPSLPMFALEFRGEVNRQETRVMGLFSSEDRMVV